MTTTSPTMYLSDLTADEAAGWAHAAMAEYGALRRHDGRLFPLTPDPVALRNASELRRTWRQWATDVGEMLSRLPAAPPEVEADREALRRAVAYAKAIAAGPDAEEMLRRAQRVERGESKLYTIEEVRRELGLAPRG